MYAKWAAEDLEAESRAAPLSPERGAAFPERRVDPAAKSTSGSRAEREAEAKRRMLKARHAAEAHLHEEGASDDEGEQVLVSLSCDV